MGRPSSGKTVFIEGDSVLRYHDLTVFVAPPPDGVTLLSRGPYSSRYPKAASRAALWQVPQEPEAFLKMEEGARPIHAHLTGRTVAIVPLVS